MIGFPDLPLVEFESLLGSVTVETGLGHRTQ
jgi:hypothetical protein